MSDENKRLAAWGGGGEAGLQNPFGEVLGGTGTVAELCVSVRADGGVTC
jgi:hypothetical protein